MGGLATPSWNSIGRLESSTEDWATAICSGAPPFLRLQHPAFDIETNDPAGEEAARLWIDTICGKSSRREAALWAVLGLDRSSAVRAFGRARLATDEPLPRWVDCLIRTVRALPQRQPACGAGEDPTTVGTRAFFEASRQLLDWDTLSVSYPFFDPCILHSLTRQLVTRVILACGATLELEHTGQIYPIWDFSRGAWLQRLSGFTGLNFVVGTAIRQWQQNALEMLTRIGQDLSLLQQTLLAGTSTGSLVAVDGDLGDRHNDGRSVAVLTFACGNRVVYKPKDLRCAQKFLSLLDFLNAAARFPAFPTRKVLCRQGYAWEEYVEQRQAETEEEAGRFFRSFGMLLRVLQLVEGRDFWIDNLRVNGEWPVFIDLECILHPRVGATVSHEKIMGLEPELYEESVLSTAAVTQTIDIPGFGAQDFGGLSSPGPRLLPLGMWSGYRDQRNGNLWLKGGRLYWEPELAWPRSAGKAASAIEYLRDLEEGFRESHSLLCRCAAHFLGAASPLVDIGDIPVRVLMRSTWEYLVLLRASLEPTALLDGNARELALAHVLSTAPNWGCGDNENRRLAIARRELDALRVLDIPDFYNLPSNTSLVGSSHFVVPDVFVGSAHARLRKRLSEVDTFDIETHVQILRSGVRSIVPPPN